MRPVLSICIPTYQRSRLLAPLLRELDAPGYLPFSFEVVVADNASADAGYEEIARYQPANYTLRYYRNQQNIGAIPNLFGVLRRAQGELSLYLADDDRLDPTHLISAVEAMIASPGIAATHCSWRELDRVSGAATPPFIAFDDLLFTPDDAGNLVQHYFFTGFLPEIGLYRTDILADCLFPTGIFFWPLALTHRLLQRGSIQLTDNSFYYIVTRHPGEPIPRDRLTNSVDIAMWERVSRSHDFLMLHHFGNQTLPPEDQFRSDLSRMRNWSLNQAMLIHFQAGDYLIALELSQLLKARGADLSFLTAEQQARMARGAALLAFVEAVSWTPEITSIALLGFDDPAQAELSRALKAVLPPRITLGGPAVNTVFLIGSDAAKSNLIDQGVRPGLIVDWQGLQAILR